jgi:hypothetical protein
MVDGGWRTADAATHARPRRAAEDIFHRRIRSDPDRAPPQTQTLTDATRRRRVLAHRLSSFFRLPQELFSQVGQVKKHGLNFDQNGRSKGTAEVIFANRQSAMQAIKSYNGVKLDGKPLRIELVGGGAGGGVVLSSGVTVTGGPRQARIVAASGPGGRARKVVAKVVPRPKKAAGGGAAAAAKGKGKGRGRGKKGPKEDKPTPMTSEQLDAQLDSYKGTAAMEA